MTLVDEHHHELAVKPACQAVGVSRATWYRRRARAMERANIAAAPEVSETNAQRVCRAHPRRIPDEERHRILGVLCEERFMDQTPRGAFAALLSEGTYLCSVRSMYRILGENRAVRERRPLRSHERAPVPRLVARAPNQVWTWDITKLPGIFGGWYSLYVILDLYSRFVVGWRLAQSESGLLAAKLVEETAVRHGVERGTLIVHSDRGAPMTSKPLSAMLAELGFERSHARPRTSNDNAFSESQFKTIKYGPMWPSEAMSFDQWNAWCVELFEWYNRRHHHEGIGHFTPEQVFGGEHLHLLTVRQRALDEAFARNPERFVNGRPIARAVPTEVWINRPPSPSGGSPGAGPANEAPRKLATTQEPLELVNS
jgi:transposase InsO family protein